MPFPLNLGSQVTLSPGGSKFIVPNEPQAALKLLNKIEAELTKATGEHQDGKLVIHFKKSNGEYQIDLVEKKKKAETTNPGVWRLLQDLSKAAYGDNQAQLGKLKDSTAGYVDKGKKSAELQKLQEFFDLRRSITNVKVVPKSESRPPPLTRSEASRKLLPSDDEPTTNNDNARSTRVPNPAHLVRNLIGTVSGSHERSKQVVDLSARLAFLNTQLIAHEILTQDAKRANPLVRLKHLSEREASIKELFSNFPDHTDISSLTPSELGDFVEQISDQLSMLENVIKNDPDHDPDTDKLTQLRGKYDALLNALVEATFASLDRPAAKGDFSKLMERHRLSLDLLKASDEQLSTTRVKERLLEPLDTQERGSHFKLVSGRTKYDLTDEIKKASLQKLLEWKQVCLEIMEIRGLGRESGEDADAWQQMLSDIVREISIRDIRSGVASRAKEPRLSLSAQAFEFGFDAKQRDGRSLGSFPVISTDKLTKLSHKEFVQFVSAMTEHYEFLPGIKVAEQYKDGLTARYFRLLAVGVRALESHRVRGVSTQALAAGKAALISLYDRLVVSSWDKHFSKLSAVNKKYLQEFADYADTMNRS